MVVKNRQNALQNPLASYAADLDLADVLNAPPLAWPLSAHEAAVEVDGAVVMVLASEEKAGVLCEKPVWILGAGWCSDSPALESREWGTAPYIQKAAQMAYRQAGMRSPLQALDFAEVDDTYAYKELQALEALGIFRPGEAGALTAEGLTYPDGDFPVNNSGGSLGVGHLLDATGLARTLEALLQLRGEAGPRQLEGVEVGLVQSWRGVPTTSGAVLILAN